MLRELNSKLRSIIVVIGVILLILNLTEKKTTEKSKKHGYQSEIYDDLW